MKQYLKTALNFLKNDSLSAIGKFYALNYLWILKKAR